MDQIRRLMPFHLLHVPPGNQAEVDRSENMRSKSDTKSTRTCSPTGEPQNSDNTMQNNECSVNLSGSSESYSCSSTCTDSEHKLRRMPHLQNKVSKDCTGGTTSTVSRMRADYIPCVAAGSDNISYAVGNQSSAQSFGKRTNTIVVVPSIDLDTNELMRMGIIPEHYEERQLYHLILLMRDPSFRIIFVTSNEVNQETIRYYLTLDGCSDVELTERLSRLFLLNPEVTDLECHSLSQKVIQSEELLNSIRRLVSEISDKDSVDTVGISYYCGSDSGDALAESLNFRSLEAGGKDQYFGCKQGSRELFYSCNIPCPPGTPDIGDDDLLSTPNNSLHWSRDHRFICKPRDLAVGIARLIAFKKVKPQKWVVKLNQGFSGKGNACLDLQSIQNKVYKDLNGISLKGDAHVNAMADDIENSFSTMIFVCKDLSWTNFIDQMSRLGAIAETFLKGACVTSPSVQAVIDADLELGHRVHILSTHEQILSGQIYAGCVNPAAASYRSLIVEYTKRIGEELARQGVVGHFAVDYLAKKTPTDDTEKWNVTGIEINLRQGGTTHSYSTMAALCGGHTGSDGVFRTKAGKERYYEATDSYIDHRLAGLKSSVFLTKHLSSSDPTVVNLRWNHREKMGVVFHLLSLLEIGEIGFTAIGETSGQANKLFEETTRMLNAIAETLQMDTPK